MKHTEISPAMAQAASGRTVAHESALAQVAGAATYIDDMPELRGTLHAAPILSTRAHGHLSARSPPSSWQLVRS